MRALLVLPVVLLLALAACGGGSEAAGQPTDQPATAEAVVAALKASGLPVGEVVVYTAETDPNKLLGRPGGYAGKAAFRDTRITSTGEIKVDSGGDVEMFTSEAGAKARADYVLGVVKVLPLVSQYVYHSGPVVLRLSRELTPDQAAAYETALKALKL
jgi:hypothetical protein